ncbi:hypothetical protein [Hymenobacter sp. YC55]|uniref:hypothetical protein n=1 Tax=Hymenobacter sp. YC55 TaxID=3034019 RepID=UPI0023F6B2F2|nr:hypothetical protein [Hymenobacter sp. YC55]MDF7810780.1 hypothetical protein [Hymenobacter sp. YC55]
MHKHNHYTIIRRTGIEKIAAKEGIRITFEVCTAQADYAAVKATAKKPVGTKFITVESFGSACQATSQNKYYLEMAEKRAKSRVILQISDLYQEGVYGEDEADDFARSRNPEPEARPLVPAAQEPTPPASAAPAPFVTPDQKEEEPLDKAIVVAMLKDADTLDDLRGLWLGEAKPYHNDIDVYQAKEDRKVYLQLNQKLA